MPTTIVYCPLHGDEDFPVTAPPSGETFIPIAGDAIPSGLTSVKCDPLTVSNAASTLECRGAFRKTSTSSANTLTAFRTGSGTISGSAFSDTSQFGPNMEFGVIVKGSGSGDVRLKIICEHT